MRLSLFSDYSLRVLMFAALKGEPFSLSEVSDAYGISRNHLVKVVNHLAKLGYLGTKRGRGGGIGLAMAPEDIFIGLLVRRTESQPVIVECFDKAANTCPLNGMCRLKGVLADAMNAFFNTLDKHTLRDLVSGPEGKLMADTLLGKAPPPLALAPAPTPSRSSGLIGKATKTLPALLCLLTLPLHGEDVFENAPIHYSAATPKDAAQKLEQDQIAGRAQITRGSTWETLFSLLKHFGIPQESQVMVFSKTSKQNDRISPATPRVVYFSDNAYVGYSLGGVFEVSTIDPVLGPIFYLCDPHVPAKEPLRFQRDQSCLSCHGGPFSPDVPGVLVRSVFPDEDGHPIMSQGSTVVDTTTPFEDRWGGWYVTGRHGSALHRGNITATEEGETVSMDFKAGANVTSLSRFFDVSAYPRKSSDIVALMVLEHQTSTQNILTKANHTARRAMHMQTSLQRELGEKVENEPTGTARRMIDHAADDVVAALLFKDEATLPDGGIEGDPAFQTAFAKNARTSKGGRSLKDFQLLTRLFKYRCSYMIHSLTFANLLPPLKKTVMEKLTTILDGRDTSDEYSYLSESERRNIREILADTLPEAPAPWRAEFAAR